MFSDRAKLSLLGACLCGCMSTLFTSSSFGMGGKDLRTINAPLNHFCKEPRNQAKSCLDDGIDKQEEEKDKACASLLSQASRCEDTVNRAYRHINMGGCPREIQQATICEVEWCDDVKGNGQAEAACHTECAGVRSILDDCVKGHVSSFFKKDGMRQDGTRIK